MNNMCYYIASVQMFSTDEKRSHMFARSQRARPVCFHVAPFEHVWDPFCQFWLGTQSKVKSNEHKMRVALVFWGAIDLVQLPRVYAWRCLEEDGLRTYLQLQGIREDTLVQQDRQHWGHLRRFLCPEYGRWYIAPMFRASNVASCGTNRPDHRKNDQ